MENRNNNPIAEEIIHNNPTGYGLFAGIGDNFNSAAQAICELADDAISNLRANSDDPDLSMTIVVSFENLGDAVEIGVVDGGTGITNLDSALTIACRDGAQTPLNEHGFGLKHALASCDSSPSQQWSIRTRTKKDAAANQYREVTAPYSMGTSEEDQPMKVFFYPGAGGLPYPTGTAVTVRCPMAKFQTVKPDRKAAQSDFHHLVMYAIEELRYIYAGVLADTNITMKVLEVNGDRAVVQLFDSSAGINLRDATIRFLGHPLQLGVSADMLGRVFNGMGEPIDGGPALLAEEYRDINGLPMNPAARDYPNEFIQTGVSTISIIIHGIAIRVYHNFTILVADKQRINWGDLGCCCEDIAGGCGISITIATFCIIERIHVVMSKRCIRTHFQPIFYLIVCFQTTYKTSIVGILHNTFVFQITERRIKRTFLVTGSNCQIVFLA